MKKMLTVCFIVSLFSLSLLAKATIKFKAIDVDFGKIEEGKIVEVKFEFENVGDSLLTVKRVLPSCGCTTVGLAKKEYKPGEKGEIIVKFDPKGYYGRISKSVMVHTTDPDSSTLRLQLMGDVILKNFSQPAVEPETLELGAIKIGKRYKHKIKIKNIGTTDLDLLEMFHDPEIIPEFSEISIKPKQEAELILIVKPMKTGRFEKWLRVNTNSMQKRLINIRISADVK